MWEDVNISPNVIKNFYFGQHFSKFEITLKTKPKSPHTPLTSCRAPRDEWGSINGAVFVRCPPGGTFWASHPGGSPSRWPSGSELVPLQRQDPKLSPCLPISSGPPGKRLPFLLQQRLRPLNWLMDTAFTRRLVTQGKPEPSRGLHQISLWESPAKSFIRFPPAN